MLSDDRVETWGTNSCPTVGRERTSHGITIHYGIGLFSIELSYPMLSSLVETDLFLTKIVGRNGIVNLHILQQVYIYSIFYNRHQIYVTQIFHIRLRLAGNKIPILHPLYIFMVPCVDFFL